MKTVHCNQNSSQQVSQNKLLKNDTNNEILDLCKGSDELLSKDKVTNDTFDILDKKNI